LEKVWQNLLLEKSKAKPTFGKSMAKPTFGKKYGIKQFYFIIIPDL
jgi:hypothetical protein